MLLHERRRRAALLGLAPFCLLAAAGAVPRPPAATPPAPAPGAIASAEPAARAPQKFAPAAPPDGSYVYAISRNGTDRGTTTVTLTRRADTGEIEFDELGYAAAARADIVGSYRATDLSNAAYVATYRAPFLRGSPLGSLGARGIHGGFGAPVTVRYRIAGATASATIDGVAVRRSFPVSAATAPDASRVLPAVFDAPFMAGVMFVPAFRHRASIEALVAVSEAFDEGTASVPLHLVAKVPHFPKTPKTDAALEMAGVGTLWFDRANYIVHEAHFDRLNFDVRLIAYSRTALAAELAPIEAVTPKPHVPSRAIEALAADGSKVAAVVNLPASGHPRAATVVFVPPPGANRNFSDDGPEPMYPELARSFAERGYAVVRYDARPAGTWEQALLDASAVVRATAQDDAVDPSRIYLLGYGVGADLALAESSRSDPPSAGVIALAPAVVGFAECAKRTGTLTGVTGSAFLRSASPHDPATLALRSRVPLFVLHPGVGACRETRDETTAYDQKLRAANARATIVLASDLSARFGGLYDADAPIDTQAFFPYRFDGSTESAIGDWLDNPKTTGLAPPAGPASNGAMRPHAPPPPPPVGSTDTNGEFPNPHASSTAGGLAPGIVLPSGVTPPPVQIDSTAAPRASQTSAAPAPSQTKAP